MNALPFAGLDVCLVRVSITIVAHLVAQPARRKAKEPVQSAGRALWPVVRVRGVHGRVVPPGLGCNYRRPGLTQTLDFERGRVNPASVEHWPASPWTS